MIGPVMFPTCGTHWDPRLRKGDGGAEGLNWHPSGFPRDGSQSGDIHHEPHRM